MRNISLPICNQLKTGISLEPENRKDKMNLYEAKFGFSTLVVLYKSSLNVDHLCGLVVRVPGCRSRGPASIPGTTRLSE
jgi:hypothetical protein